MSASFLATPALAARGTPLRLHNPHTLETLSLMWSDDPSHDDIAAFNALCRDWRRNATYQMDTGLLDALAQIVRDSEVDGTFSLLSGYRTFSTNAILKNAARNSLHMRGQAVDVRHSVIPTLALFERATATQAGGLGFYTPDQGNFIHIDTGPVRTWGAPSVDRPAGAGGGINPGPNASVLRDLNVDFSNPFPFSDTPASSFSGMKF